MKTASKLLILLCLISKKAKGSFKYSSLEEALHAIRTTVSGSEDFTKSEKSFNSEEYSYYYERPNSEEFSYYEKSNSEESSNLERFLYSVESKSLHSDKASKSKDASNSSKEFSVDCTPDFSVESHLDFDGIPSNQRSDSTEFRRTRGLILQNSVEPGLILQTSVEPEV